ncbi:hypothetical protein E4U39_004308 [Claviceps sp. Clav50 group G5]|nr:hypothetical protein E4U39_004308 [Claviceps sp. Clav50 group G5]
MLQLSAGHPDYQTMPRMASRERIQGRKSGATRAPHCLQVGFHNIEFRSASSNSTHVPAMASWHDGDPGTATAVFTACRMGRLGSFSGGSGRRIPCR